MRIHMYILLIYVYYMYVVCILYLYYMYIICISYPYVYIYMYVFLHKHTYYVYLYVCSVARLGLSGASGCRGNGSICVGEMSKSSCCRELRTVFTKEKRKNKT